MEVTKENLREILEKWDMEHMEEALIRIIDNEDFDYKEHFDNSAISIHNSYENIYHFLDGKLTPDERVKLLEMIELYTDGNIDLFFELGFFLGCKKHSPFSR